MLPILKSLQTARAWFFPEHGSGDGQKWEATLQTQESLAIARVVFPSLPLLVSSCKESGSQPQLLPLSNRGGGDLSISLRQGGHRSSCKEVAPKGAKRSQAVQGPVEEEEDSDPH